MYTTFVCVIFFPVTTHCPGRTCSFPALSRPRVTDGDVGPSIELSWQVRRVFAVGIVWGESTMRVVVQVMCFGCFFVAIFAREIGWIRNLQQQCVVTSHSYTSVYLRMVAAIFSGRNVLQQLWAPDCSDWEKGANCIALFQCKWLHYTKTCVFCEIQAHRPVYVGVVTCIGKELYD